MARTAFDQWIQTAEQLGVFRYVLPFLLVFLLVYGILERLNPFGGGKERVHAMLAVVIGLFVTVFTPAGASVPAFFSSFFGAVAVALVGMLAALVVAGFVFGEDFSSTRWSNALGGIGVLVVVAIFLWMGGLSLIFPGRGFGTVSIQFYRFHEFFGIAVVVGALAFMYWALGEESGGSAEQQ
ncbi:MAG: hypothetical protein SVQ76_01300 [Candidatus Nanohaloarchaea archaeon]|nr:hypothetical protein [Candidatus Nanohaloarchaea archaeon]